ncbi:hypothetical protein AURDEDRAFT_166329 [Auricularia subglabra TFB-10046 SS5]|uniref:Uncharacterized protein n=1 Tax=Auricularia subglabra (strain TFB-10046 / SS5) TaxID=717982 RepID=J0LKK7_AURST|nr:hypothetical protein AURDEDRAFT_166329 [Auricularia subglabra TFB-10046 SS5]
MSSRKGYVAFEWTDLDFSAQLDYLLLLLQNLPIAIPTGTRIYKFHRPIYTNDDVIVTGSRRKAVLRYLEATFGPLECDETTFIAFQERGDGLDAVVQVIQANVDDSPDDCNVQMKNWVTHLIASASRAYRKHNTALPTLKRVHKPKIPGEVCSVTGSAVSKPAQDQPEAAHIVPSKRRGNEEAEAPSTSKRAKATVQPIEVSSDDDADPPARPRSARTKKGVIDTDESDVEMVDGPLAVPSALSDETTRVAPKAPKAIASIFLAKSAQKPSNAALKKAAKPSVRDADNTSAALERQDVLDDVPPVPKARAIKAAKKDKSKARVWLHDPDDLTDIEEPPPKKLAGKQPGRPRIELVWQLTIPCKSRSTGAKRWRCSQGQCKESFSSRQKERVLPHHIDECDDVADDLRKEAMILMSSAAPGAKVKAQDAEAAAELGPGADSSLRQSTLTDITSAAGRKAAQDRHNLAVVKLFATGHLASRLLDRPEWKAMIKSANPRLETFSSTTLAEVFIPQEAMRVRLVAEGVLKTADNLTISFDGGSNMLVQSVYTVHVTAADTREPYLMLGHEASGLSHDAEYIVEIALKVMKRIGMQRFICVVSDSTGNTRKARELLEEESGIIIGLADAPHHLNLTLKDICALKHFALTISNSRLLLRYFSLSSFGTQRLQSQAQSVGVTRSLEGIGKTRFASINRAGVSILRNLPSIKALVNDNIIFTSSKDRQTYLFLRSNSQFNVYHATLSQLVAVLSPLAKAQKCLESTHVHPGHVLLFWLAALATIQDLFNNNAETLELPQPVMDQVISIVDRRFDEMFGGPDKAVFKAALFLDPAHVRSALWRKSGYAYSATKPQPDDDLRSTIPYYVDIGAYLLRLLQKHIKAGHVDLLKGVPPKELATALRVQLPAYARQEFPFNRDSSGGWRAYWSTLSHHPDGSVLSFLAIKLLSMVPNSMAEERTMSAFTKAQDGRSGMQIRSLVSEVQVSQHYAREERLKKPPVKAPDLVPFRELSARVRSEAMSGTDDRFSHPKSQSNDIESARDAADSQAASVAVDPSNDTFGAEFNEVEGHDVPDSTTVVGSSFRVTQNVDLSSVLLRDLLSDSPLAAPPTEGRTPLQKATGRKGGDAQEFNLDEADFAFDV